MADDDLYSLQNLARNQMTHYGPDPRAEEVGRRVRATGQNFYNSWFGPLERLGRSAMTGTLDTSNPQAVQDAFNTAAWATGGRMPFAKAGTLGTGGGKVVQFPSEAVARKQFMREYDALAGEQIRAPALRMGTDIYEGTTHALAADKGLEKHGDAIWGAESGFTTTAGRFVTAEQARVIAERAGQTKAPLTKPNLGTEDLLDEIQRALEETIKRPVLPWDRYPGEGQ